MPSSARILLSKIVLDILEQKGVKGDTYWAQIPLEINSIEAEKDVHCQGIKDAKKTKRPKQG